MWDDTYASKAVSSIRLAIEHRQHMARYPAMNNSQQVVQLLLLCFLHWMDPSLALTVYAGRLKGSRAVKSNCEGGDVSLSATDRTDRTYTEEGVVL